MADNIAKVSIQLRVELVDGTQLDVTYKRDWQGNHAELLGRNLESIEGRLRDDRWRVDSGTPITW